MTEIPPNLGPCTWPVSYAECGPAGPEYYLSPAARAQFESAAVDYLWRWTNRQFGLCPVSVRPCRTDCYAQARNSLDYLNPYLAGASTTGWVPVLVGGAWFNLGCGWCGDQCSCGSDPQALRLPGPVDSVTQVLVDGVALDPSAYRVDNRSLLVRLGGSGWPSCQSLRLPTTEAGTWEVSYLRGTPVPEGGQLAAGVLAVELAKATCCDSTCRLPQRVQSITRQGVTVAVVDAFQDVEKGRTGIWLIDSWVASVTQPRLGGRVRSVDVPSPRVRQETWTEPVTP